MYDTAKKAREAMKSKARRLAGEKDQKVDSSDWTPAEPINADVKTGMRPVSRRAYKGGGKVMGEACEPRMDKKPRKSGGKAMAKEMAEEKSEATEYAKAKINRNVKDANEDRPGIKHVGGMKKGGRAKRENGGGLPPQSALERLKSKLGIGAKSTYTQDSGEAKSAEDRSEMQKKAEEAASERKYGGRSKRASGGKTENYKKGGRAKGGPVAAADKMLRESAETSGVPSATLGFTGVKKGLLSPIRNLKSGGATSKSDRPARKGKFDGGSILSGLATKNALDSGNPFSTIGLVKGLMGKDKDGAEGKKKGGRVERRAGGRTRAGKGGTKINIMIAAGKPASPMDMAAPPAGPMGGTPPGFPVPMPGDGGGAPPQMPMPMPMPAPPAAGPAMGGGAGLPLPRKSGGRITKVAKSYKDMEAGAGSGEGRLQKTDIASHKK